MSYLDQDQLISSLDLSSIPKKTIAEYLEPCEGEKEEYLVNSSFLKSLCRGYRFGTQPVEFCRF